MIVATATIFSLKDVLQLIGMLSMFGGTIWFISRQFGEVRERLVAIETKQAPLDELQREVRHIENRLVMLEAKQPSSHQSNGA